MSCWRPPETSLLYDVIGNTKILKNIVKVLEDSEGMKEVRVQRNPLNILKVENPLLYMLTVMLKGMDRFIHKRNLMELFSVLKPLYLTQVSKYIREHKLNECHQCGNAFVDHNHLKRYERVHHGEKP